MGIFDVLRGHKTVHILHFSLSLPPLLYFLLPTYQLQTVLEEKKDASRYIRRVLKIRKGSSIKYSHTSNIQLPSLIGPRYSNCSVCFKHPSTLNGMEMTELRYRTHLYRARSIHVLMVYFTDLTAFGLYKESEELQKEKRKRKKTIQSER